MVVLYFTSTIDAAGCYRCLFPGRELRRQRGWTAGMPPYKIYAKDDGGYLVHFDHAAASIEASKPDIVVFQQPLDRDYYGLVEVARRVGAAVVVDDDDYHLGVPVWNPAFQGTHPTTSPDRNRNVLHGIMALADMVTVSTPFLADQYARFNPNIRMVPNFIDWEMWNSVVPVYERKFRRVRVGWMGDSRWRKGDLNVLRGFIGPWLARNPHVEFVAAGDPSVHDYLDIPHGQRVSTASVQFHALDLADITAVMDIGLVPLEMMGFNEAKSCLKGMEYAACGIPCIASPTRSYRDWVGGGPGDPGDVGRLAKRPKDWLRALTELVEDTDLRQRMAFAAREKAKQHTIQERVDEWETVLLASRQLVTV